MNSQKLLNILLQQTWNRIEVNNNNSSSSPHKCKKEEKHFDALTDRFETETNLKRRDGASERLRDWAKWDWDAGEKESPPLAPPSIERGSRRLNGEKLGERDEVVIGRGLYLRWPDFDRSWEGVAAPFWQEEGEDLVQLKGHELTLSPFPISELC